MKSYGIEKLPSGVLLELAKKHAALRKQKGYSQIDLAKRSGVSLGSLRRFEQTGKVSLEHLVSLAHVLQRLHDFDAVLETGEDMREIEKLFTNKVGK